MGVISKSWKTKCRQIRGQVESSFLGVGTRQGGKEQLWVWGIWGDLHGAGPWCSLGAVAQLFSPGVNLVGAAFVFHGKTPLFHGKMPLFPGRTAVRCFPQLLCVQTAPSCWIKASELCVLLCHKVNLESGFGTGLFFQLGCGNAWMRGCGFPAILGRAGDGNGPRCDV